LRLSGLNSLAASKNIGYFTLLGGNNIGYFTLWCGNYIRLLVIVIDKNEKDNIQLWRTTAKNEVDFVLSNTNKPEAIEAKYDKNLIKANKYNLFSDTYPDLPLNYWWVYPFDEDFFRRIY